MAEPFGRGDIFNEWLLYDQHLNTRRPANNTEGEAMVIFECGPRRQATLRKSKIGCKFFNIRSKRTQYDCNRYPQDTKYWSSPRSVSVALPRYDSEAVDEKSGMNPKVGCLRSPRLSNLSWSGRSPGPARSTLTQPGEANLARSQWSEKIIRHLALHVLPFPSSCYLSRSPKKTYSAFLFHQSASSTYKLVWPGYL
jgi:hypothetical protein